MPTTRVQRKRNDKVLAILEATGRALGRDGYHNLSLERIGSALDLTKAALYHYFPNKDTLVARTIQFIGDESIEGMARVTAPEMGSAGHRLRLLIAEHLRIVMCDSPESAQVFTQPRAWPPSHQAQIHEYRRQHARLFRRLVDEGTASGELHPVSVDMALRCLHGALAAASAWHVEPPPPDTAEAEIATATDTLMCLFGGHSTGTAGPAGGGPQITPRQRRPSISPGTSPTTSR